MRGWGGGAVWGGCALGLACVLACAGVGSGSGMEPADLVPDQAGPLAETHREPIRTGVLGTVSAKLPRPGPERVQPEVPHEGQPERFDPSGLELPASRTGRYAWDARSERWRDRSGDALPAVQGLKLRMFEWDEGRGQRSMALEVVRGERRVALFTHIDQVRFRADKPQQLAMINWVQKRELWHERLRVVDLETGSRTRLPQPEGCTQRLLGIDEGWVIVGNQGPDWAGGQAAVCTISTDGELGPAVEWEGDEMFGPYPRVLHSEPVAVALVDHLACEGRLVHVVDGRSKGFSLGEAYASEGMPACRDAGALERAVQTSTFDAFELP